MWEFAQDSLTGQLKVDQAFLNVSSSLYNDLWLYQVSDECIACPYKKVRKIPRRSYVIERINTATQLKWSLYNSNVGPYAYENSTAICTVNPDNLGQFGVYNLTIGDDNNCTFHTHQAPVNRNLSILLLLVFVSLLYIILKLLQRGRTYYLSRHNTTASTSQLDNDTTLAAVNASIQKNTSNRLQSLDAFRGLAIVAMIFANSGCGKYHWIEHASWNGIHPADFVFPSFLWIMGVCIPISLKSQFAKNIPRSDILSSISIRSVKLFLVGLLIHTAHGPEVGDIRIMGVLQRFGIAYLVVASLQVLLRKQVCIDEEQTRSWRIAFLDITSLSTQWIIMFIITAFHLIVVFWIPVPNCPSGYLGPGGMHENFRYNNCIGGATGYIDRLIIGNQHLYQRPRAAAIYDETMPFDPEGLFGCLLTIVQVFFGIQCGNTLLLFTEPIDRLKRWISWSIGTILIGGLLCQFSINDGFIPINKNLWSLSFVFVTTGFAFLLLSIFYVIIDIKKYWTGRPLTFAGMNAIIMYIGSELLGRMYPFYFKFNGMNTHFMFLLANVWNAAAWNLVAYYLYRNNIFFSL